MANPSKKKGTMGEAEVLKLCYDAGIEVARTAPGTPYDLESIATPGTEMVDCTPFEVLVTRPDRGRWLATLDFNALLSLFRQLETVFPGKALPLRIEVKRYHRLAIHNIFETKFGKRKA
ncbi:MAG: hypothetical protein QXS50_04250 [Candidatus Caldarchaeum sp.]